MEIKRTYRTVYTIKVLTKIIIIIIDYTTNEQYIIYSISQNNYFWTGSHSIVFKKPIINIFVILRARI